MFKSPQKKYRSPKSVKAPKTPSPKRRDYTRRSLKKSDKHSRCTFINPDTKKRCKNPLGLYPRFCWIHTLKIENLTIGVSGIEGAGYGLFAGDHGFKRGEIIAEYSSPKNKVSLGTLERRCKGRGKRCWEYVFCKDEDPNHPERTDCYDAKDIRSTIARFPNDAQNTPGFKNNAYFEVVRGKVVIKSSKKIGPGEEIFVDYGGDYWE
jgi:hypothetical protein